MNWHSHASFGLSREGLRPPARACYGILGGGQAGDRRSLLRTCNEILGLPCGDCRGGLRPPAVLTTVLWVEDRQATAGRPYGLATEFWGFLAAIVGKVFDLPPVLATVFWGVNSLGRQVALLQMNRTGYKYSGLFEGGLILYYKTGNA